MNNSVFKHFSATSVGMLMLLMSVSCVNEAYEIDMDKINLEVSVFQEGLIVPVGSTDVIRVKDLVSMLDEEYQKYFEAREKGVYSIYFADSYDFSDSLDVLKEMVEIEDIDFSQDIRFSLSDVDVSDVRIDAFEEVFEERLADAFEVPELPVFLVDETYEIGTGMYEYAIDPEDRVVEFEPVNHVESLVSIPEGFVIPEEYRNDDEIAIYPGISVPGVTLTVAESFGPKLYELDFNMTFPEGIRSVDEVVMKENARIRVSLTLTQSLLTSGTINPYVDLDVSELLHLTDESNSGLVGTDHILADFAMPATGGTITKEYGVKSVVFNEEDWSLDENGCLVLDKNVAMAVIGKPIYDNVTTTTNHIANCGYDETLIELNIEFLDFEVDYARVTLDPVTVEKVETVPMDVEPIELPEGISGIDHISFAEDSGIDFSLSVENMDRIPGLGLTLESLEIILPEEMEVDDAVDGKIVYENVDISAGFADRIKVRKFSLPAPVDGRIFLDKAIEVRARAVADGSISTADIPTSEAEDLKLGIKVSGSMEIADYVAVIEGYEYAIDIVEHIEEEVPETLEGIGEVVVYPEGDPVISIDVLLPQTALPIGPVNDGICISLPEMLKLKDVSSDYDYNPAANTVTFRDEIPSHIELPIDRLVLTPVKVDDKCYVTGDMGVTGTVGIGACTVYKKDVDELASADSKVVLEVHIPELVPSRFSLDQYTSNITEEFEFTLLEPGLIPEEIVSVGKIELKDVYADISLDASSLPDIGEASLELDFSVALPELLVLGDGVRGESGIVKIQGSLDKDRKIVLDPIRIEALDLTGIDLRSEESLVEKIGVDGVVTLSNAELDLDQWMEKDHNVRLEAAIRDINIERMTGKVAYHYPLVQTVNLTDFKSMLNSDNYRTTLDLAHVHLAVDLETNLAISAMAKASFVPYYGSESSEPIEVELNVEAAQSGGQTKKTKYWLGENSECCPEGYTFKRIPILELLRELPDSIRMNVDAGTDSNDDCVLEPDADYILKADYALDIPMRLGDEFKFEFRDTLSGIDPVVSTIFRTGNLVLTGEIESSLPFELDLKARLFDADGNAIELQEGSGEQIIKGGNLDGTAQKMELYLKMSKKEGSDIPEIDAVELQFAARSVGHGAPITEDTYVKAVLQALVPDGVTVDLRDFMEDNEEEAQ